MMLRPSLTAATIALFSLAGPALAADPNPERNAYYGETHLHTSWSFDAFIFGNTKLSPADAYDYAKGKPLQHPLGFEMKISRPLDWMGVTDHSEYVGVIQQANTPGTPLSNTDLGKKLVVHDKADIQRIYLFLSGTMLVEQADSGTRCTGAGRDRMGSKQRDGRCRQRTGQVHCIQRVRVDVHTGQLEPASERLLPRRKEATEDAVQLIRFAGA